LSHTWGVTGLDPGGLLRAGTRGTLNAPLSSPDPDTTTRTANDIGSVLQMREHLHPSDANDRVAAYRAGDASTVERRSRRFTPRSRQGRRVVGITEARSPGDLLRREGLFRRALALADVTAAALALVLVLTVFGKDDTLKLTSLAALPLVVLISKVIGLYDRDELVLHKRTLDEAPALFQLATLYALLVFLLESSLIDGEMGRRQIVGLWASLFVLSLLSRAAARLIARRRAQPERCLLIGEPAGCRRIKGKLESAPAVGAEVVGIMDLDPLVGKPASADMEQLRAAVIEQHVHRVIIAPVSTDSADTLELVRASKLLGVRVSLLPRMLEVVGSSVEFDDLDGMTMLAIRRFGLTRSSRAVKRSLDLIGSTMGLLATAPILAAAALAIRLESPGPIFFRQTRVGRDGERFEIMKLRTMVPDAEERKAELLELNEADGFFKMKDDPRITRVGKVLRRTALDELPQLFNVVAGKMSLVGPRPLVLDEDRRVEGMHRNRLHLTPGMTGHWQILGSSRIPMSEMVNIDYLYVANWSLWVDVKILLRTVPFMLARRGL